MSMPIQQLSINNYKSVRHLAIDCERINVFIGKPNAGKSNILEAISLLGAGFWSNTGSYLKDFIRYNEFIQLFSNFNVDLPIEISTNEYDLKLAFDPRSQQFEFNIQYKPPVDTTILPPANDWNLKFKANTVGDSAVFSNNGDISVFQKIRKYHFKTLETSTIRDLYLYPPSGDNFYSIVQSNADLKTEIRHFLEPNGLEFLLDTEARRLKVVQKTADLLLSYPLNLIPDTFQRYIFHLAAILSNSDAVILFEEPEVHSYVPYVNQLAEHILNDNRGNQFFLTTHNPYLLMPIMQTEKDTAIFVTWFENYETHVRMLSKEEIREMLDFGVDIFLNLDHFIPA